MQVLSFYLLSIRKYTGGMYAIRQCITKEFWTELYEL